ncbi:hypothetical protein EPO15_15180 [bacterium]|nr:MAG: hypothetical protein EPO15_15180 [bacterium]
MTRTRAAYHWDLFWMLTRTEFRLRDQGTLIGFLWTLLHPLFIFLILHALFVHAMSPRIPQYASRLLIGIVQWNFFSTGTSAGLTSLRRKSGIIASHAFPRLLVVLSSVAAVLLSHLLEWGVLLAGLCAAGTLPNPGWLALPFLVAAELALVAGVSCLLALWAVHLRDLERAWSLLLYGLFFMTPVFYTAEALGGAAPLLTALNPLAWVIEGTRAALLDGALRPSNASLGLAAGLAAFCAAAGTFFSSRSRGIAERL